MVVRWNNYNSLPFAKFIRYYIKLLTIRVFPSYYFLGTAIGTVISLVTSGLIADNPKLGWEGVFYIHGGLSLIWCILWTIFVRDCPENHHLISADELEYIQNDQCSKHRTNVNTLLWDPYVKTIFYLINSITSTINNAYFIFKGKKNNRKVPWLGIASSVPFWALLIAHVLNNFGWYMLLVELPMFLSDGLGFEIKEAGLIIR